MLAAEYDEELVVREQLAGHPANLVERDAHVVVREVHLGQREDAVAVRIGARFLVPQLHLPGRQQDLARAIARAGDVTRGLLQRHREDNRA